MAFALLKTFLVLVVGIFSGYLCQKLVDKNHWITPKSKKEISIFLQKLGMLWFVSVTYIGSLWIFKIESITKIISMPFVGAVSIITGGFFAVMISKYLKECFIISLVKFIVVPATILLIALLLDYQSISQGLPLKVSLILSAMPVAFNSVIAANIYNLNVAWSIPAGFLLHSRSYLFYHC